MISLVLGKAEFHFNMNSAFFEIAKLMKNIQQSHFIKAFRK
jgi:hypothetical protein